MNRHPDAQRKPRVAGLQRQGRQPLLPGQDGLDGAYRIGEDGANSGPNSVRLVARISLYARAVGFCRVRYTEVIVHFGMTDAFQSVVFDSRRYSVGVWADTLEG